jgi:proline dehydrogenase
MGLSRNLFLWASQSRRLRELLPKYGFIRRSVHRFMPGEEIDEALVAARKLQNNGLSTVLTHLGENVNEPQYTNVVRDHYLDALDRIRDGNLNSHISVKLSELGLDIDPELCHRQLTPLIEKAERMNNFVWIDMESSRYTDATLEVFRLARSKHMSVGLCLQSYLNRTGSDLVRLFPLNPRIRLVKGAYAEPPQIAFKKKSDTDRNFAELARILLQQAPHSKNATPGIATHDEKLLRSITKEAEALGIDKDLYEIQMLYGIRTELQQQLVREGFRVRVLISYGTYWFPWYMRRLAERPANISFVLRNLFAR